MGGEKKPRGKVSAYTFFQQACREDQQRNFPNQQIVFADFAKQCAERWKALPAEEKKVYGEMAERDKERFESEMEDYGGVEGEGKKKRKKDPHAPKRALSAFFWFCSDERSRIREQHPEYKMGDIAKELGRLWGQVDPQTKKKYEAMSQADKARYAKEIDAYKAAGNGN